MTWETPLVLHGAHRVNDGALAATAADYRGRLERLIGDLKQEAT
jgi:hypothetical protein